MLQGLETIISYLRGELQEEYSDFFNKYHSLYGPHGYCEALANLQRQNPEIIQLSFPPASVQRRPIPIAKLSASRSSKAPAFLITGMIHAREFISGEVCLGVLESLISDYRDGDKTLKEASWYFLPVINPDGFVRNVELIDAGKRFGSLQRKNMDGVDLNRNFDDNFAERAWTTKLRFSPEYAGTKTFSEPETQFLKEIVEEIRPRAVINFHSFSNAILYPPYSSPENDARMQLFASRMSEAMLKPYAVVQGSHFLEYSAGKLATKIRHPTIEGTFDGWLDNQGIPSMLLEISQPSLALAAISDLAGYNPPPSELGFHKQNCALAAKRFFKDIL